MGWWETINGMGQDGYQKVSSLIQNPLVRSGASSGYQTVSGLFKQIAVVPDVIYETAMMPDMRRIPIQTARIYLEDVLPLILVSMFDDWLQQCRLNDDHQNDETGMLSVYILSWMMFLASQFVVKLCQVAAQLYKARKTMQSTARSVVLTLEASNSLIDIKNRTHHELCEKKKCPKLVGTLRANSSYWVTRLGIGLVRYIPYGGWYLAEGLSIEHTGRYVQQSVMPELCEPHQMVHLRQHAEHALALGLGHWLMSKGVTYLVERYLGIPAMYFESSVKGFMTLFSISLAAHLAQPAALEHSRRYPGPVAMFQMVTNTIFDIVLVGANKVLPPMLKKRSDGIDWSIWTEKARVLWNHDYLYYLKLALIPRLLRSTKAFTGDPVMAHSWEAVRQMSINLIEVIEKLSKKAYIRVATQNPEKASKVLRALFNLPKPLTKQALSWLGDSSFIEKLNALRIHLYAMVPNAEPIELQPVHDLVRFRENGTLCHPVDRKALTADASADAEPSASTVAQQAELFLADEEDHPFTAPKPASSSQHPFRKPPPGALIDGSMFRAVPSNDTSFLRKRQVAGAEEGAFFRRPT